MEETLVRLERAGSTARLILDRPQRHNSLVPALLEPLLAHCDTLAMSPEITSVILQAKGPSFSTGGDVAALFHHYADGGAYAAALVGLLNGCILALCDLPQVTIAAVDGQVTGGALGLILGCDLVLVTPRASFTPYYVQLGFAPDGGWSALLPERIGLPRARQVQLLNQTIDADLALSWGLASEQVDTADLPRRLDQLCAGLAGLMPGALHCTGKRFHDAERRARLARSLEAERALFVQHYRTQEAYRGMARFLGIPVGSRGQPPVSPRHPGKVQGNPVPSLQKDEPPC